jgi:hypothetical protein
MKICIKCNIEKEECEFPFRKDINKYRNECKKCSNIYSKKWIKENSFARKNTISKYHKNNVEKEKIYRIEYEKTDKRKKQRKIYNKIYNKTLGSRISKQKYEIAHPEVRRQIKRRYRAKKVEVNENFTKKDEKYIMCLFNNRCFNCGTNSDLCIDHVRPLSMGFALTKNNACVLCRSCNSSKSDILPEEFYNIEKLTELLDLVSKYNE